MAGHISVQHASPGYFRAGFKKGNFWIARCEATPIGWKQLLWDVLKLNLFQQHPAPEQNTQPTWQESLQHVELQPKTCSSAT
mmetsp:Transcript_65552/g.154134  ORF Transcript_65552/g.154134 Transcript_65552/m.154134 type:complete len:82 (+) Transcript_65552:499-744(+)